MRNVNISLDENDMISIAETIGSWEALFGAIGYLSTWNLMHPNVRIYRDGDTDLIAVYSDAAGRRQFVLAAVWHADHYGFHS